MFSKLKELSGNSHFSRWLIALILLPPVLYALFASNYLWFLLVVSLVGSAIWWEFINNLLGPERRCLLYISWFGWIIMVLSTFFLGSPGQQLGLLINIFLAAFYVLGAINRFTGSMLINIISRYALGLIYICFIFSFIILLKKIDAGEKWILYLLLITIAADTGAFYSGRQFKGPKLYEKVSPKKTVSGLFGGALSAMVVSMIMASFLPSYASFFSLMGLGLFLGLWGAVGDLFESALKRALEIKDSSNLLMGHGGFMDRLDSFLFNLPVVYLFVLWKMN